MPTKAELEAEIEALNKSIASLKGQITKLKNAADAPAPTDISGPANNLVDGILKRGMDVQVGQKQLRLLCEALGRPYSRGEG